MEQENDLLLSKLAVRIRDSVTPTIIGSGIIYYSEHLNNQAYILTAAHCLYSDGDSFGHPRSHIEVEVYDSSSNAYKTISHAINYDLVFSEIDKDVAVLVIDKAVVEGIIGNFPLVEAVKERQSVTNFIAKGFPSATLGQELVCIYPTWAQVMTGVKKFQLHLNEDYKGWATDGFSGSGVFLHANNRLYLYGIFTRYREEDRGKVIYCQFIDTVNELLERNFLSPITFSFLGEHGLTPSFFHTHTEAAVKNLGPRFNRRLNFRLPIAQRFHDIAKDSFFKKAVLGCLDKWLTADHYHESKENLELDEIESAYRLLKKQVQEAIPKLGWRSDQKLDIGFIISLIDQLEKTIQEKRTELYAKQWEIQKHEREKERSNSHHAPYENELGRLREIYNTNHQLLNSLNEVDIKLANTPFLLIDGEAGNGKSHLLGDITTERNRQNQPTLLLLGQLFKGNQTVWQNIMAQLRLNCSPAELLTSLNNIGKQIESRVLILIDALNEGAGKELWPGELAGFIHDISQYSFIGLVLTVRSTYWNAIVPSTLLSDSNTTRITHEGFKGNEYAALSLFCEFYGLQQPNFPILAPEFTKPLFLQIICEGVKASQQKLFPQGFQGIVAIFDYYLKAVSEKLANKREQYRLRNNLVEQAIRAVAEACFRMNKPRILRLEEATKLFDDKFAKYPYLLDDLILESVLIQNSYQDYESKNEYEVVYFAYERFGDFLIAKQLLEGYPTIDEIRVAFSKGNTLSRLIEERSWSNRGVLEALAVLLPEKYNVEIVEVFEWVFDERTNNLRWNADEWISSRFLESLKWRTAQSINNEKLTGWLKSGKGNIGNDEWFLLLIELTILPDHPLNGDRLYQILKRISMPERDSFWQQHLISYHGIDDNGNGFPIKRLIDWAWQPLVSTKIDIYTARLTGQTLAWVLATTNRALRDRVTKAMVNLLEEQPDALLAILNAFSDTDDMYISERLYAVAYGCALRTSNVDSLLRIAQYVFDMIFRVGNPPEHILLRDYARNTVEFALSKQLPIEGDTELIRPPYRSRMPAKLPSEEDLSVLKIDVKSTDETSNNNTAREIRHSVMDWDFGHYVIDPALSDFSPVNFRFEEDYKAFLKGLKPKIREWVKYFASSYESQNLTQSQIERGIRRVGKEAYEEIQKILDESFAVIENKLKEILTEEEHIFLYDKVVPYLNSIKLSKNRRSFDTLPIRRWIVQRVFELGFDHDLHGYFDSNRRDYTDSNDNKIERIGKKYQWIAFYQIMSIIADNYKVDADFSSNSKYKIYQGPWQLYLRNIDPAFTSQVNRAEEVTEDELGITIPEIPWWMTNSYTYWNHPSVTWAVATQDLPNPTQIIQRTDPDEQDWLYLRLNVTWKEPKPIGQKRYKTQRKDLWYMFQGYLVPKKNKAKTLEWLKKQDFGGRWLPETGHVTGLYNRENYWSPISKANQKERKRWVTFRDFKQKVIIATDEAVGEMSEDKSGAHFHYEMPCQTIFEGMELQYAPLDGEFKNKEGDLIVTNANPRGVLIRKNDLVKFLDKNDLDIIWVLLGEKRAYGEGDRAKNNFSTISGVYYLDANRVAGTFILRKDKYY